MSDTKGYIAGEWNAYCDYCEGQYLASQLKKDYWGFMACPKDFTLPNPQMFVRPVTEKIVVPWSRPSDGASSITPYSYTCIDGSFVAGTGPDPANPDVNLWHCNPAAEGTGTFCVLPVLSPSRSTLNIEHAFTFVNTGNLAGRIVITPDTSLGPCTVEGSTTASISIMPGDIQIWVAYKQTNKWRRIG